MESKTNRKLISVKPEYSDVWRELVNSDNASLLVCQAVRFYISQKKKQDSSIDESRIREIVKDELLKLIPNVELKEKDEEVNLEEIINNKQFENTFSKFKSNFT